MLKEVALLRMLCCAVDYCGQMRVNGVRGIALEQALWLHNQQTDVDAVSDCRHGIGGNEHQRDFETFWKAAASHWLMGQIFHGRGAIYAYVYERLVRGGQCIARNITPKNTVGTAQPENDAVG